MASFDFLSLDFIDQMSDRTGIDCKSIVQKFFIDSICERVGAAGEYIRLNDVIRDYAQRTQISVSYTHLTLPTIYSV